MAVNPDDLFVAAKALGQGETEVDLRNATSRAYYAAYHRCLALGQSLGLSAEQGRGVHRQLLDTLLSSTDQKVRSVAHMLEQCRRLRVQADYEIETDFSSHDTHVAIKQCEKIMTKASTVP